MKYQWSFVTLPYGEEWRRKRKLMHTHVHQGVAHRYYPFQISSARRLVRDLLAGDTNEEALPRAIRLNFAQMVTKAVYGIDVDSYESEFVALAEKVNADFSEVGTPGRFLVDVIPIRTPSSMLTERYFYPASSQVCSCVVSRSRIPADSFEESRHSAPCP
jgi:cytochrome P450